MRPLPYLYRFYHSAAAQGSSEIIKGRTIYRVLVPPHLVQIALNHPVRAGHTRFSVAASVARIAVRTFETVCLEDGKRYRTTGIGSSSPLTNRSSSGNR
jgi:hypothetical protein